MNISSSLSTAIAELGSQPATPPAAPAAAAAAASVSASSALIMKVADETVSSDNGSLGSVDAWA